MLRPFGHRLWFCYLSQHRAQNLDGSLLTVAIATQLALCVSFFEIVVLRFEEIPWPLPNRLIILWSRLYQIFLACTNSKHTFTQQEPTFLLNLLYEALLLVSVIVVIKHFTKKLLSGSNGITNCSIQHGYCGQFQVYFYFLIFNKTLRMQI